MWPITITFPAPSKPISANQTRVMHWRVVAEHTKMWREATYLWALKALPGGADQRALPPCDVQVTLPFRQARRRDPDNYHATTKWIIDGLGPMTRRGVGAGLWPDDTAEWVTQHQPIIHVGLPEMVIIEIWPMTEPDTAA